MPPSESPEYHVRNHPSAVEHWRHLVEIVAFVVAAAWGFYTFVYQEDIKPSLERPNFDFTVNVEHTALGHGKELVTVTPSWRNRGAVTAQIDGFLLDASGVSYTGSNIAPWHNAVSKALSKTNAGLVTYSRGLAGVSTPLYAMSQRYAPLGMRSYMAMVSPGDTFSWARSFVIPRGRFDAVRIKYSWCIRRGDDRSEISFHPVRLADGTYDVGSLPRAESQSASAARGFRVYCEVLASGIEHAI